MNDKNEGLMYYCGFPATKEYIENDLRARGLNQAQIECYLLEVACITVIKHSFEEQARNGVIERGMNGSNQETKRL